MREVHTSRFAITLSVLIAILVASGASWSRADTILNPGTNPTKLTAQAFNGVGNPTPDEKVFEPTVLPFGNNHTASQGLTTNTSTYGLTEGVFHIEALHSRTGTADARAESFGRIYFSVTDDTPYSFSGQYSAVDPIPGRVSVQVRLTDLTGSSTLFNNRQLSDGTPNESFVVGGTGGDSLNTLTGNQAGMLLAGREYEFFYDFQTRALSADDGATAGGHYDLRIGAPAVVPLPTAVGGGLALFGVIRLVHRRPGVKRRES